MGVQKRRAIVHIGHEKTGSTSLQYSLSQDREVLRKSGYLFPKSPGNLNHTGLVVACMNDGVIDNIKAHKLARTGLSEMDLREKVQSKLSKELSSGNSWHTLLITSELITSRLFDAGEVDRLISLIQSYVEEIEIIFFIRRQDRLAVSRYSSVLRSGYSNFNDIFADTSTHTFLQGHESFDSGDLKQYFDYDQILNRFEGRDGVSLNVQIYDQANGDTDPIKIFYEALGYKKRTSEGLGVRLNNAMSAEAQYVISQLNKKYRVTEKTGLRNEPYRSLLSDIEAEMTGHKRRVARTEAEVFHALFTQSNTRVRERYFPDIPALFDDDFSDYPEVVDYSEMKESLFETVKRYEQRASDIGCGEKADSLLKRTLGSMGSRFGLNL